MKKWISTKDKLPKHGKKVLTISYNGTQEVLYLSLEKGCKRKYWFDRYDNHTLMSAITHYQELPKAPNDFKMKLRNGVPSKKSMRTLYSMYQNLLEENTYFPQPAFNWSYATKKSKGRFLWICKDTEKHIEGLKLFLTSYGVLLGKLDKTITNGFNAKIQVKGFKEVG